MKKYGKNKTKKFKKTKQNKTKQNKMYKKIKGGIPEEGGLPEESDYNRYISNIKNIEEEKEKQIKSERIEYKNKIKSFIKDLGNDEKIINFFNEINKDSETKYGDYSQVNLEFKDRFKDKTFDIENIKKTNGIDYAICGLYIKYILNNNTINIYNFYKYMDSFITQIFNINDEKLNCFNKDYDCELFIDILGDIYLEENKSTDLVDKVFNIKNLTYGKNNINQYLNATTIKNYYKFINDKIKENDKIPDNQSTNNAKNNRFSNFLPKFNLPQFFKKEEKKVKLPIV